MSRLESAIEAHLERRCRERDIFLLKNTGMNGIPDRQLIHGGRCWFLELKRPGNKPTKLQEAVAGKLRRHGAVVLCADTEERVDSVLDAIMQDKEPPRNLRYGLPGRKWDPDKED